MYCQRLGTRKAPAGNQAKRKTWIHRKTHGVITIEFGLELDGEPTVQESWGHARCGPQALVSLLEFRLGLPPVSTSSVRRAAAYRGLLETMASRDKAFFRGSLELDPVGVSHELLRWRDELVFAGWNPELPFESPRLQLFAELERLGQGTLPMGLCDRLKRIAGELSERSAGIRRLILRDPRECLPALWIQVLDGLGAELEQPSVQVSSSSSDRDLARLAETLSNPTFVPEFQGDGSVQIWETFSEVTLSRALAQRVREAVTRGLTVAVVAPDGGAVLESGWRAEALPTPNFGIRSRALPIPQLLGLCLRLIWDPLDPRALIDFLTHPVCPVPNGLRRRLASALAACPGISGPGWCRAIAEAQTEAQTRARSDGKDAADVSTCIQEALSNWIDLPRFPESGADRALVASLCLRLSKWAAARAATGAMLEVEQFRQLAFAASELAGIVAGEGAISRLELGRWVERLGDLTPFSRTVSSEAGAVTWVRHPTALDLPHDLVVWMGFEPPKGPMEVPWSGAERRCLSARQVLLPTEEVRRRRESEAFKHLISMTRQQLLLARPRFRRGEMVRMHPIHARLNAAGAERLRALDVDACISSPDPSAGLHSVRHPMRPLPRPRRWWRLEMEAPSRAEESFTSLALFIYHPHKWLLRYAARLKTGPITEPRGWDAMQAGAILDRLACDLFSGTPHRWLDMSEDEIGRWVHRHWIQVVQEMALNLLQPGNRVAAESIRETARRALVDLARLFRDAGVDSVVSQAVCHPVALDRIRVSGIPDLVCHRSSDGGAGILDLKLGSASEREKELIESRALQLAIYRRLGEALAGSGRPPATGYYVLGSQRLLTGSSFWGKPTVACPPDADEVCWLDALRMWRWREGQMAAGWIEVVHPWALSGDGPADGDEPPVAAWRDRRPDLDRDPFRNLVGWNPTT